MPNFALEIVYAVYTQDASLLLLYSGAKIVKMAKRSNQGAVLHWNASAREQKLFLPNTLSQNMFFFTSLKLSKQLIVVSNTYSEDFSCPVDIVLKS